LITVLQKLILFAHSNFECEKKLSINTVAIISPGDMGHAVARVLREHGLRVITCLSGRSDRTKALSRSVGIEEIPNLQELAKQSDLILSIIPPSETINLARQVAIVLRTGNLKNYFADCNAVSPLTVKRIDSIITEAGGRFVDASIIGTPPGKGEPPRFYASGPHANLMAQLDGKGIKVRIIGNRVGQASGIKMCYPAWTKGSQALWITLLTAAEAIGLSKELKEEFLFSQPSAYKKMEKQLPRMSVKARRWVGEMDEIASTFEQLGLSPYFHKGASEVFRYVGTTPFADETPENLNINRTLEETISVFAKHIQKQ
jgi:3-hydroxyisobutyrate dehydrogenase-like beta-hydroxyacid dehydrogenase